MIAHSDQGPESVLLVTGTLGAGKTATAMAAYDILEQRGVPVAFVDLDGLSYCRPSKGPYNEELVLEAIGRLWPVYRAAGAKRLVLARVVETREALQRYEDVLGCRQIIVCRVTASPSTCEARLRAREPDSELASHLARTQEVEGILQRAQLEDFTVENEGRPIEETAQEVLVRS